MRYVLSSLIMALTLLIAAKTMAAEKPKYTVEMSKDRFEIRQYPSMILAEVTVTGDRNQAASRGFRKLAAFIFGDNEPNGKIAMTSPVVQVPKPAKIRMTSPVVQTPDNNGEWTVNFMMPSKYSMDTLPMPTDQDIRIYESKPYRTVSLRFSGRGNQKSLTKHREKLEAFIAVNNLSISGGPEYAFYDAPFVPPMLRRNEVHYRLAETSN